MRKLVESGVVCPGALFEQQLLILVFEIIMINRREGSWTGSSTASGRFDFIAIVIGTVAFAVVGHFHEALFGVAPISI